MKFGLTSFQFSLLERLLIDPLKLTGAKVWIFGSRARGDHEKFSDIDILFEASEEVSLSKLSEIKEALEESDLPFKVDLVNLKDLADSFRMNVMRDRFQL